MLSNLSEFMALRSSKARILTQVYQSLESMFTPLCCAGIGRGRQDVKSYMHVKCVCVFVCKLVHMGTLAQTHFSAMRAHFLNQFLVEVS